MNTSLRQTLREQRADTPLWVWVLIAIAVSALLIWSVEVYVGSTI